MTKQRSRGICIECGLDPDELVDEIPRWRVLVALIGEISEHIDALLDPERCHIASTVH